MSAITPVAVDSPSTRDFLGCTRMQYQNVKAGDTCVPVNLARYTDRSVQVTGTYDGATVEIHGTCENDANYAILTDSGGLDLRYTSGLRSKFITEGTPFIKPVISGGTVDTLLTITVFCRGQVA